MEKVFTLGRHVNRTEKKVANIKEKKGEKEKEKEGG